MGPSRSIPDEARRQQPEGRLQKGHRRNDSTLVQHGMCTDRVTGCIIAIGWLVVPVVMRMPVIGLHGDGVLHGVKLTQGTQDGLEQHADRHQHQ